MAYVLILDLYIEQFYDKLLEKNLEYYNIRHRTINYTGFDNIDFSIYTHIILTGSDFFVDLGQLVLSREQISKLLSLGKPILAQCYAFHLLTYYLCSNNCLKIFKSRQFGFVNIYSPLVRKDMLYFVNHYNYVDHLDNNWDVISKKTILDSDGSRKTFITDAIIKRYPVLCLQYHPEINVQTYSFIYNWVNNNFTR
jgi:hypothetical protein